MSENHQRKKQPQQVRRSLLDEARRLAESKGLSAFTLHEVAKASGVTKGGLFHHFSSKQALIEGIFLDGLTRLDSEIDEHIRNDERIEGSFTRAYVESTLSGTTIDASVSRSALAISMIMEPSLRVLWSDWLHDRLKRHKATDSGSVLEIVRLAADGAWLSHLTHVNHLDIIELRRRLILMTQKAHIAPDGFTT